MTTTPDPTPTPETPMPDPAESTPCNNPGHDHHLAHGLNCTDPMAWAKADDDFDPPADSGLRAHTACTSTFRVAGDPPCDVHRDGVHRCDPQIAEHGEGHECECGQEWTPAEAAMASNAGLDALVGRFNALSDAAGNPGAPAPSGRGDRPPSKATPIGALSYAIGHAEQVVGPGVSIAASDVLAGLAELGWVARPRVPGMDDPVDHHPGLHTTRARFDQVDTKLDAIHALVHGLPHPAVLAQIHERLDRIEYVTENIAAAVDNPPPADRTLSAMDRVERHDAEAVIVGALTDWFEPPIDPTEVGTLAIRIAQALYGPTPDPTPVAPALAVGARVTHTRYGPGTITAIDIDPTEGVMRRVRWDAQAEVAPTHPGDWCTPAELTVLPDEGAPTEGDDRRPPTPAAGFLPHGARVRHPRFGPATVRATAWTPDEGYTAKVEWDLDPGGGTEAWVDSATLTLLTEGDDDDPDDQIPPNGAFHGHAHDDYGRER